MTSTDTLALYLMPQNLWHMALTTWLLLPRSLCKPVPAMAMRRRCISDAEPVYNCLSLLPYASCLIFWSTHSELFL